MFPGLPERVGGAARVRGLHGVAADVRAVPRQADRGGIRGRRSRGGQVQGLPQDLQAAPAQGPR